MRRLIIGTSTLVATLAISTMFAAPPPPPPQSAQDSCGYPSGKAPALSSVTFSESDSLQAFEYNNTLRQIRAWYMDEHALTLGVRRVVAKTKTGTTTTDYPITPYDSSMTAVNPLVGTTLLAGSLAGTDLATWNKEYGFQDHGRPLFPALFVTDVTLDPTAVSGDWQMGGVPVPPTTVYGTWKGAVRTVDSTKATTAITVTPDADPAKNYWNGIPDIPAAGFGTNEGYGSELVWDVNSLNLAGGHTYRFQFMVHDGDQNKSGGDAGEACVVLRIGIIKE